MKTYTYKLVEDEHGNIQCGDKLYRFEETIKYGGYMKIIDLLNKIANGEEVPKKIRFDNTYWNRICGEKYPYYVNDNDSDLFIYFFRKNLTFSLNDEVEIIEEEKKIPEKIPLNYADDRKPEEVYEYLRCSYNQLIDYLKSKGE